MVNRLSMDPKTYETTRYTLNDGSYWPKTTDNFWQDHNICQHFGRKVENFVYLYELTENLYGSAYSLYAGDAGSVVPLFASGVGVDVDTDLLHHDEEGAGVQAGGEVPQVQIRSGQASGCDSFFEHHRQHLGRRGVGRQATILFGSTWFGIISAMTTLLVLVFSEIVPKTIGTSYWKNLMGFVTSAISFLSVLMWPLVIMVRTIVLPKEDDKSQA